MPPRRPHTKSRNGCEQCKKRRVKCDEVSPTCSHCAQREAEYQYLVPPQRTRTRIEPGSAFPNSPESVASRSHSTPARTTSLGENSGTSTRRRELELMQFWFLKTCHSFSPKQSDLFRGHVVSEALKHEFLADSIFAITSLHKASETSESDSGLTASYVAMALEYQNNNIVSFRNVLHHVTPSNCDAIFISAIITLACSVVSPFLPAGDHEPVRSSLDSVLVLHEFLHGIRSVVEVSCHWIASGPCKSVLRRESIRKERVEGIKYDELPAIRQLRRLNDARNWNDQSLHSIYGGAISHLEYCFEEDMTWTFDWLEMAGNDFNDELQNKKPMALVTLMYWGILLDKMDEIWWAKYSGHRLVKDISVILLDHGPEWHEATAWAKKEVRM